MKDSARLAPGLRRVLRAWAALVICRDTHPPTQSTPCDEVSAGDGGKMMTKLATEERERESAVQI
jgi:hypothetical protein